MAGPPASANSGGGGYNRPILGAVVTGLGNVVQGLFNRKQSKKNTKRTNRANMELAKYQYDRDIEMWERNNAYNTPEAQMARLQKAGLNPHLVYGNGSVVGNTSGQTPQYHAPRQDFTGILPPDIGGLAPMMQQYNDYRMREAQIDNVKASTRSIDATRMNTIEKTLSEMIKQPGYQTSNLQKLLQLEISSELAQTQVQTAQGNLRLLEGKISLQEKAQVQASLDILFRKMINIQQEEKNRNQPAHEVLDMALKELDMRQKDIVLELMKEGVNFNDPVWMRKLAEVLGSDTPLWETWLEKIKTSPVD